MQLKLQNAAVELSGEVILENVNIEIYDGAKIAIVGRNGSGKSTLLRLISGEISPAKRPDTVFSVSGNTVIGVLNQMTFEDNSLPMVYEIRSAYKKILEMKDKLSHLLEKIEESGDEKLISEYTALLELFTLNGGFYFEKEYEAAIKSFGFSESDKYKPLSEFSGGQRTKIAFLKLLLSKPDILLLDEPTNHLDINAVSWLENYIKDYKKAVVVVSHDRMFLDKTVNTVYEIEHGKTTKYLGGYTDFTKQKKALREQQAKLYTAQQKEIERLDGLVERFRYKATKASMAQSKLKELERLTPIDAPESYDLKTFHSNLQPDFQSVKDVLLLKDLEIGFDKPLAKVSLLLQRGERLGIIGGNGLGKSTLLKTIVGNIPALSGGVTIGGGVKIGYFDQQIAQHTSKDTVLDDYLNTFKGMGNFEARSDLGAFQFSGEDVFKRVDMLSGGERVRLALCKIFKTKPNLLILDEPTNHMDMIGKETLEEILLNYTGTLLFVSHDRYFVKKLADRLAVFEDDTVTLYNFGYEEYLDKKTVSENSTADQQTLPKTEKKAKKGYTTPAKERAKLERKIKKCEENIALLEEKIENLKNELEREENITDYIKLQKIECEIESFEAELLAFMEEWEALSLKLNEC